MLSTWRSNPCLNFACKLLELFGWLRVPLPVGDIKGLITKLTCNVRKLDALLIREGRGSLQIRRVCARFNISEIDHASRVSPRRGKVFFSSRACLAALATEICCWTRTIPTKASFNFFSLAMGKFPISQVSMKLQPFVQLFSFAKLL